MTGSEQRSKTTAPRTFQLPLKGMNSEHVDERTGRVYRIEGMGDGRYRVHTAKRQPKRK